MYLFDWKILGGTEGMSFEEPKNTVNLNNLISYEVKKDSRFELVELKKGLFNTNKKHLFKANTEEDLRDWVNRFEKIVKKL